MADEEQREATAGELLRRGDVERGPISEEEAELLHPYIQASPRFIQDYYILARRIDASIRTAERISDKAYAVASETLRDEQGRERPELLDTREGQERFLDAMEGVYAEQARRHFKEENQPDAVMTNAYAGITRQLLDEHVRAKGRHFTPEYFRNITQQLVSQLRSQLTPNAHYHIRDEHIDDIVKHVGYEGLVERDEQGQYLLRRDHATDLLRNFHELQENMRTPEGFDVEAVKDAMRSKARDILPGYALKAEAYK